MWRATRPSWNLMVGRNPLLVAREHGHRLTTMLSVYAAWAEGAVESDIAAIREAMNRQDWIQPTSSRALPGTRRLRRPGTRLRSRERDHREEFAAVEPDPSSQRFGSRFVRSGVAPRHKPLKSLDKFGGKGGTRKG